MLDKLVDKATYGDDVRHLSGATLEVRELARFPKCVGSLLKVCLTVHEVSHNAVDTHRRTVAHNTTCLQDVTDRIILNIARLDLASTNLDQEFGCLVSRDGVDDTCIMRQLYYNAPVLVGICHVPQL